MGGTLQQGGASDAAHSGEEHRGASRSVSAAARGSAAAGAMRAAQDRAGELEQLELVRVNDGSPWLYSARGEPSLSAREQKNWHDYVRVYRNDIDGKVQKVFSQLSAHAVYL